MAEDLFTSISNWGNVIIKREISSDITEPCGMVLNYQSIPLHGRYSNVTCEKEKVCQLVNTYFEHNYSFTSLDNVTIKRERSSEPSGMILNYRCVSLDERYPSMTCDKEEAQVCQLFDTYLEHNYCSFQKELPNGNGNDSNEVELRIKGEIIIDEDIEREEVVENKKLCSSSKVERKRELKLAPKKISFSCNKVLSTKYNLISHSYIHKDNKPYKCTLCQKSFPTKGVHKKHLLTHARKSLYTCDICNKTFQLELRLKFHYRTHTQKKKPIECVFCRKRFTQKSTMRVHLRIHTGEKPYSCESCNKCFSNKMYLRIHLRTHSGVKKYRCNECLKCFTQKSSLNLHARQHTGVKPFSCKLCKKRFLHKSYLKAHYVTHSGIKSFKCELCAKYFTQKSSLNYHMASHNKG